MVATQIVSVFLFEQFGAVLQYKQKVDSHSIRGLISSTARLRLHVTVTIVCINHSRYIGLLLVVILKSELFSVSQAVGLEKCRV